MTSAVSSGMAAAWLGQGSRPVLGLPIGDVALALGMAAFAAVDVFAGQGFGWLGPLWLNGVLVPLAALSLAWRRRFPTTVLALVLGILGLLSVLFGATESASSVFIVAVAVYSGAVYAASPLRVLGIAGAGVVVRDLNATDIVTAADRVWSWLLVALTFAAGLGVRAHNARNRELEAKTGQLERERREVATAVEEERRRIARELHDIVSHSLGVMVLQAGAAATTLERNPEHTREALTAIRTTGLDAIGEMGTLLDLVRADFDPSQEPTPRLADVNALVTKTRQTGLPIDISTEGRIRPLPAAVEMSAFRIIQEGLTNTLKHSNRAPTHVTLRYRDDELEVEVTDEGGIPTAGPGTHRGLAGLDERVAVFGGRLLAGPRPGGGWTLQATLPVPR